MSVAIILGLFASHKMYLRHLLKAKASSYITFVFVIIFFIGSEILNFFSAHSGTRMPILIHSFHERLSADTHSENELLAKYLPQQIDALFCRIYESLKVLGIRIRSLELYLRTPLRTSFSP